MKKTGSAIIIFSLMLLTSCRFYTTGAMVEQGLVRKKALLVLDMQKDLLREDGRLPVKLSMITPLLKNVNEAIEVFSSRGDTVVYIKNIFPRDDFLNLFRNNAVIEGDPYTEFDERLLVLNTNIFEKKVADAFSNKELELYLSSLGITDITVCGVYADQCVYFTARGALERGYSVSFLYPAVASTNEARVRKAASRLRDKGVLIIDEP